MGTALIVVTALFFGAGGWYFAGQIYSGALAVEHDAPRYDLTVLASGDGTVTLREQPGQASVPALRSAEVYGLDWPGGSGVLGPPSPADGGAVRRSLQVIKGALPGGGTAALLDRDVYADPSALGLPFQDVNYDCPGGRCPAWYVPGAGTTWAVLVHGRGATRSEPLRALAIMHDAGLPALDITYRNDVGAPADPSGEYRYGQAEWHDLAAAIDYAHAHGAARVVLFGSSMGGAIVAAFLEQPGSAVGVAAVVLDAPMLDFARTVDLAASQRHLPLVGLPIPQALTTAAERIAAWRYHIDYGHLDYRGRRWLTVPAVIFHGTADATVPISTSNEFARANPDTVTEVAVPGAGHLESWNVDQAHYREVVKALLARVLGAVAPDRHDTSMRYSTMRR